MKKTAIALFITSLLFSACDFDKYQVDPNRTSEAPPGLFLTNLIVNSFNNLDVNAAQASRMLTWVDGQSASQYYTWQRAGFEGYGNILQAEQMIQEADRSALPNYVALAKFFKAYHYYQLTMAFGDVPLSDALDGYEENYTPSYDQQEDIFNGILILLDEANDELSDAEPALVGDVLFDGDLTKWKKAINSFRLRVLLTLSEQEGSSSIDIRAQFAAIVADPSLYPIMLSNEDNLALQHYDVAGNRYPYFDNQNMKVAYPMEQTFVELMKDRSDPRLFQIAEMNALGSDPSDFASYGGLDGSASFEDFQSEFLSGVGSFPSLRYSEDPTTEPTIIMSYAEVQFILAEAVELGWIAGSAADFYNTGITANMEYYGVSAGEISTYLAGSNVAYNSTSGIEMINTQKYLTYFLTSGWEAFYNQRRTGYPEFSATDFNSGRIPTRWMYPQSELNLNTANVNRAIKRQFTNGDNTNGLMWLLK